MTTHQYTVLFTLDEIKEASKKLSKKTNLREKIKKQGEAYGATMVEDNDKSAVIFGDDGKEQRAIFITFDDEEKICDFLAWFDKFLRRSKLYMHAIAFAEETSDEDYFEEESKNSIHEREA
ncbi:MAG: hypothetical protein LKE31_03935 [Bacilli bacterium]|jgi:uncharacterized protein (DUF1330 family)|nr:hypothetical protein [Bacilli bacterium]